MKWAWSKWCYCSSNECVHWLYLIVICDISQHLQFNMTWIALCSIESPQSGTASTKRTFFQVWFLCFVLFFSCGDLDSWCLLQHLSITGVFQQSVKRTRSMIRRQHVTNPMALEHVSPHRKHEMDRRHTVASHAWIFVCYGCNPPLASDHSSWQAWIMGISNSSGRPCQIITPCHILQRFMHAVFTT